MRIPSRLSRRGAGDGMLTLGQIVQEKYVPVAEERQIDTSVCVVDDETYSYHTTYLPQNLPHRWSRCGIGTPATVHKLPEAIVWW